MTNDNRTFHVGNNDNISRICHFQLCWSCNLSVSAMAHAKRKKTKTVHFFITRPLNKMSQCQIIQNHNWFYLPGQLLQWGSCHWGSPALGGRGWGRGGWIRQWQTSWRVDNWAKSVKSGIHVNICQKKLVYFYSCGIPSWCYLWDKQRDLSIA